MEYVWLVLFTFSLILNILLLYRKKVRKIEKAAMEMASTATTTAGSITKAAARLSSSANEQLKNIDDQIELVKNKMTLQN